ncbi:MAG: MMPL family transporter [Acholeplasmataceae bacterium]|jgi:predicted RND superfamily exporter protein|nr:MMPL family transporter [Acholeplasmataceae bacterium]
MKIIFNKSGRIITLAIYLIIGVLAALFINKATINYDMKEYLPSSSNTKQSLEVMADEFGENSMIQIMTNNLNIANAQTFVNEISDLETIKSVVWLGTLTDITVPVENIPNEIKNEMYKNGKLLFTIEFNKDDYSLDVGEDIKTIQNLLKEKKIEASFRGTPITNISSREKVESEMIWIFIVAVPFAVLILFLAAQSWFEPVLVLATMGVAILINMGTNVLLPNVSYITIAIASVLQMAMSLDFSLFLIHRYYEERETGKDVKTSIIDSTKAAFSSITASALTTIFGFLALTIMQYKIGFDIGVSLAKAILVSYIVTLTFLPVLITFTDKIIFKLKRKREKAKFSRINKFLFKFKMPLTILIVLIGGAAFYFQTNVSYLYGDGVIEDDTDVVYNDEIKITEDFGVFQPVLILYNNNDKQKAIILTEKLNLIAEVTQIQSLVTSVDPTIPENIIPVEALEQFKGENYSRIIVYLDLLEENERMFEVSDEIKLLTKETLGEDAYFIGLPIAIDEIKASVNADGIWVQLLSAFLIALVIGIVFRNPTTPIILVLLIQISIWINMSVTFFLGNKLVYIGYLVVSSLQLGATIDYAVLLTSRYVEFRKEHDKEKAITMAMQKAFGTIITSSLVLSAAGFVVMLISKLFIVKEIGALIGRGALLSGLLVLFILPALLVTFDKIILKTTIGGKKNEKT